MIEQGDVSCLFDDPWRGSNVRVSLVPKHGEGRRRRLAAPGRHLEVHSTWRHAQIKWSPATHQQTRLNAANVSPSKLAQIYVDRSNQCHHPINSTVAQTSWNGLCKLNQSTNNQAKCLHSTLLHDSICTKVRASILKLSSWMTARFKDETPFDDQ